MRPSTLIRLLSAIFVLSFLACTLILAKRAFFHADAPQESVSQLEDLIPVTDASEDAISALISKLEVANLPDVTPGERAFESARALLEKGDYLAAEEKLKYVNTYYPTAVSAPEARRILGEINMDRLFLGKDFSKITQYKVKSGDSFYRIARDSETNLDLLMLLNGLDRVDRLYPGDVFRVMALNFRIVVDVPRGEVSIWDGARYIKGYEIEQQSLSSGRGVKTTKITAVEASYQGKRVRLTSSNYHKADKLIALKSPQIEIRPYKGKIDTGVVAIYLKKIDLEELVLLLRIGNSVEIRY